MSSVKGRFGTAAFKLRPFVCPKTLHNDDDDDDDCNDAFQKLTLLIKSGSQSGGELSAFSWKVKRKLPISHPPTQKPLREISEYYEYIQIFEYVGTKLNLEWVKNRE